MTLDTTTRIFMRLAALVLIAATCCVLALLLSGRRVLISERKVEPGGEVSVEGYTEAAQAQLVCRYFTGKKVLTKVFWHSPNNFLGKDECPFITSADD